MWLSTPLLIVEGTALGAVKVCVACVVIVPLLDEQQLVVGVAAALQLRC